MMINMAVIKPIWHWTMDCGHPFYQGGSCWMMSGDVTLSGWHPGHLASWHLLLETRRTLVVSLNTSHGGGEEKWCHIRGSRIYPPDDQHDWRQKRARNGDAEPQKASLHWGATIDSVIAVATYISWALDKNVGKNFSASVQLHQNNSFQDLFAVISLNTIKRRKVQGPHQRCRKGSHLQ